MPPGSASLFNSTSDQQVALIQLGHITLIPLYLWPVLVYAVFIYCDTTYNQPRNNICVIMVSFAKSTGELYNLAFTFLNIVRRHHTRKFTYVSQTGLSQNKVLRL